MSAVGPNLWNISVTCMTSTIIQQQRTAYCLRFQLLLFGSVNCFPRTSTPGYRSVSRSTETFTVIFKVKLRLTSPEFWLPVEGGSLEVMILLSPSTISSAGDSSCSFSVVVLSFFSTAQISRTSRVPESLWRGWLQKENNLR